MSLRNETSSNDAAVADYIWSEQAPARSTLPIVKRVMDVAVALAGMIPLAIAIPVIAIVNRRANPGPLFFTQKRMGKDLRPFTIIKFRSMVPANETVRGHDDPLETHRITRFGSFMRRKRLDELPQFINILRGDMSVIGPRPDAYDHAVQYMEEIPGYRVRYTVRPGLSGLAQTALGYAEGVDATRQKVNADLTYIRTMSYGQELKLLTNTVRVVFSGFGAR